MKKLNTSLITAGVGYPPSKKGWDFLMQSYTETIAELVNGLNNGTYAANTPYVIYGCLKTNSSSPFAYSKGAIFYNGEVYSFPAIASIAIATSDVCTITTTADPTADPTLMSDGSTVNIHDVRAIVLSDAAAVTNGATQFNYSSCVFLNTVWQNVSTYNLSWVASSGMQQPRFRIKNKYVILSGYIDNVSSPLNQLAFTLPVGFRPLYTCVYIASGASTFAATNYITVESDGKVTINYTGTSGVSLENIHIPLD
jgi:hypothetical protein